MAELIDHRYILQAATFAISVLSFLLLSLMIRKHVIPWRYAFLPMALLTQYILFYGHVVFSRPEPTSSITFWSAVLRFETIAGFFIVLWSVYRGKSRHD